MDLSALVGSAYALGDIRACERFDRDSSSVARVETAQGIYWLKLVTSTARDLDEMEAEAEIANALADHGVAVSRAVRRRDGSYAGLLDRVPALLFEESPGVSVAEPSLAQAEALGNLLARFHATSVGAAERRWQIVGHSLGTGPLRAMEAWLHRAGLLELEGKVRGIEPLVAEMIAIAWPGGTPLPTGLCHGDVQLENVHFADDRPTLFDLEECGTGPCIYDLACYWRWRTQLRNGPQAEWDALLRGYEQVRSLTATERAAIPALATLRAVWVMCMPAAAGVTWGQDWIDAEYIDGHLEMIERCARVYFAR